jgi:hypothetical protein
LIRIGKKPAAVTGSFTTAVTPPAHAFFSDIRMV